MIELLSRLSRLLVSIKYRFEDLTWTRSDAKRTKLIEREASTFFFPPPPAKQLSYSSLTFVRITIQHSRCFLRISSRGKKRSQWKNWKQTSKKKKDKKNNGIYFPLPRVGDLKKSILTVQIASLLLYTCSCKVRSEVMLFHAGNGLVC